MKRLEIPIPLMKASNLPRQKCRGLIEAVCIEPVLITANSIFPGRNAGASLKLQ